MMINQVNRVTQPINKLSNMMLSICVMSMLAACGGGGGGGGSDDGSSSSNASNTNNSSPVVSGSQEETNDDEAEQETSSIDITRTADLVVPENFVFLENDDLTVLLNTNENVYVSICKANSEGVDYQDCVMRTWVRVDAFAATFKIPRHIDSLAAAVLTPNESMSPQVYEWRRGNGMPWQIIL